MSSATENEIIEVEEKLRRAMTSSNIAALDKLLSTKLLFTNHLGQVISKADDIKGHSSGDLKIENLELSERQISFASELAIVSVHAKISGSYKGAPANGNFRFTRIWKNENSAWQVIVGHSSIVA